MPLRRRQSDPILAFRQHGFRERKKSLDGSQAVGDCPFCGRRDHFYVNLETKAWDCKDGRCGRSGGFQTFLREIIRFSRELPELESLLGELSADRGIAVETLERFTVGYNRNTSEYLIPVYYQEAGDTKVWDIRRAVRHVAKDGKTSYQVMSTAGCQLGILGWEQVPAFQRLWICEGEWDAMACAELLQRLGIQGDLALGVPGAGVMRSQWLPLFQKHEVIAAYDADEAGRQGALRTFNLLHNRVGALQFVHWGEVRDGYDLRDLYRERGTEAFDFLVNRLHPSPEGVAVAEVADNVRHRHKGPGLPAEEVYRRFTKWLHMEDTTLIDVVFGTVIANRQEGDPIWLHIVAPPGATKTEMIRALDGAPDVVYRNTLSAKSLISGQIAAGGADPSLLPRLHERLLAIEDWTTLMSLPPVYREEIFGVLRAAFNGKFERDYGNGRYVNIECHFGMITGVTPAIEHNAELLASLGPRFLHYAPRIPDDIDGRRVFLRKAQANRGRETEMRKELSETAQRCLTHPFDVVPEIPEGIAERIQDLALWSSMMRGTVPRERFGIHKEVVNQPYWELGTRLVKQYTKLIDGIGRFKRLDRIGEAEYAEIREVALSTIQTERRQIVRTVWRRQEGWTTAEIAEATGLPRSPLCERTAETLSMLKVLKQERGLKGLRSTYKYRLSDAFRKLTEESKVFYTHTKGGPRWRSRR